MKNNLKMLFISFLFVLLLTSCANSHEPTPPPPIPSVVTNTPTVLEPITEGPHNTSTTEIILPIKHIPGYVMSEIFWLKGKTILIIRYKDDGVLYDVYDWGELELVKSGEVKLKMNLPAKDRMTKFIQLNESDFLVRNNFDPKEAYLFRYNNNEVELKPLNITEKYTDYALSRNITTFAAVSESKEFINLYTIQDGYKLDFTKTYTIASTELNLPVNSLIIQIAFIDETDLVYHWIDLSDSTNSRYGVYSIDEKKVKATNTFLGGALVTLRDSVIFADKKTSSLVCFNSKGVSNEIITGLNTPNKIFGAKPEMTFSAGEYISFMGPLDKSLYGDGDKYTRTVMKPFEPIADAMIWNIAKTDAWVLDNWTGTLALPQENKPQLVFISPVYTKTNVGRRNVGYYGLYIITQIEK